MAVLISLTERSMKFIAISRNTAGAKISRLRWATMLIEGRIHVVCLSVWRAIHFRDSISRSRVITRSCSKSFLHRGSGADFWRQFGGLETLHSYGVPVGDLMVGKGAEEAARALNAAIPEAHREFLSSLKDSLSIGKYFLCHAGVRPNVPLDRQNVNDLFWIREEFLHSEQDFEKMIIHGHSPHEWPEIKSNRINIDTGAFATGRLTCLVIEGDRGRFLFTC